jgi:hypothetical protein
MKKFLKNKKIEVLILGTFLIFSGSLGVSAATLYGVVSYPSLEVNGHVRVSWYLDTQGESINVIDGALYFSTSTIRVSEVGIGKSLISLWMTKPSYSQETGLITFTGGAPLGLTGIVPIFESTLEGYKEGPGLISILSSSSVLVNDGEGSEEQLTFPSLQISVKRARKSLIKSSTQKDQGVWYKNNKSILEITGTTTNLEYTFGNDDSTGSRHIILKSNKTIGYRSLDDGVYYLQLFAAKSPTLLDTFSVHIDQTPPEEFTPILAMKSLCIMAMISFPSVLLIKLLGSIITLWLTDYSVLKKL